MPKTKVQPPTLYEIQNALTDALRRTAANPTIFGYKAQPHQVVFHESTKVGRLFLGGNRAGKTVAGAAEVIMNMTGQKPYAEPKFRPPLRCRAIGVDFDNGVNRIMKPEVARWCPPSFLKNGSWEDSYEKSSRTLTLTNGSTLEFMSYDQDVDKFAGTSRHLIWFDEEPPEEIFNENLLRLADVGGQWIMTMTPLIDMSWTLDRLYEKRHNNPNLDVFQVNTLDNAYINSAILEVIVEGLSEEEASARTKGLYFTYSGAIYNDVLGPCIIPAKFEQDGWDIIKTKWRHFGMLDHGFTNPTAFLIGAYDSDGRILIYREYYQSKRTVAENAVAIQELIKETGVTLDYIVADPSTRNTDPIVGRSIQAEYALNGLYLSLGNNDVTAGINRVYSRLKNRQLFITSDCEHTVWEMQRYRWDKYANKKVEGKNNAKETPMKKNDHACDALRYGVASMPAMDGEVDMRESIVFNAPSAISEAHPMIDYELTTNHLKQEREYYDPMLGTDW